MDKSESRIGRKKMPGYNFHNKMIVNDRGICQRVYINDMTFGEKVVITKEAFIEAYNSYIRDAEKKESPITLTDEQITDMYENGYISTKEEYKDGND